MANMLMQDACMDKGRSGQIEMEARDLDSCIMCRDWCKKGGDWSERGDDWCKKVVGIEVM